MNQGGSTNYRSLLRWALFASATALIVQCVVVVSAFQVHRQSFASHHQSASSPDDLLHIISVSSDIPRLGDQRVDAVSWHVHAWDSSRDGAQGSPTSRLVLYERELQLALKSALTESGWSEADIQRLSHMRSIHGPLQVRWSPSFFGVAIRIVSIACTLVCVAILWRLLALSPSMPSPR